jgi:hypothetical protein
MPPLNFNHVPDDALLTKAEVAAWRRTSVDTVEKDVRAGRLVQVQVSPRRVGITAGSVRALNRQQASDALRQAPARMSAGDVVMATTPLPRSDAGKLEEASSTA